MPKKIPDETKQLAEDLYAQGLPIAEIAKRVHISYSSVYGYTKIRERGFLSMTDYQKQQAEKKFASRTEYQKALAAKNGFESLTEYQKDLAKNKGFGSLTKYQKYLATKKGFSSLTKYQDYSAKKRQENPINKRLGDLIQKKLDELEQTRKWLAESLGITLWAVSKYIDGKMKPRKNLQEKLFKILRLPYKTLDSLLE